jgi:hypothetical protein
LEHQEHIISELAESFIFIFLDSRSDGIDSNWSLNDSIIFWVFLLAWEIKEDLRSYSGISFKKKEVIVNLARY